MFEAALARDPDYALALTGVADAYHLLAFYGFMPAADAIPKARAAVNRALQLEPRLAEAHTALAYILTTYELDFDAATREFLIAIELKPTLIQARYWYATMLWALGRFDEADARLLEVIRIEPYSAIPQALLGWMYLNSGRPGDARTRLQHFVEVEPTNPLGHWLLGAALVDLGHGDEGLTELRTAVTLSNRSSLMLATLGCGLANEGRVEEAREILNELQRRAQSEYVRPLLFALLHGQLGDRASALGWFDRACDERDNVLVWTRMKGSAICVLGFSGKCLDDATRNIYLRRLGLPPV